MDVNRIRPPLLLVLLLPLLALASPSAVAEPVVPQRVPDVVDDYVAAAVSSSGPGMAVALLAAGEVVHTTAAGQDGRGGPVRVDTPMRIESLSKSFTATAVMQLVEEGRVQLDDPVQGPLPEFTLADPRAAQITVRQLLTHTSGMDDAHAPDLYDPDVGTLRQAVDQLSSAELAAPPGTAFAYHNPNYQVLARLVEVVSGQPFAAYLAEHVFGPAGMADTVDVAMSDQQVPRMAAGHLTAFGHPFGFEGRGYFAEGSGGVISTAEDMARWLTLQSNGGRAVGGEQVVSPESVALMHRAQSPDGSDYGVGWYTAESAEGPPLRTSHSGAGGGFGAYQGLFTESGWGVAVLVNHGAGLTAADPGVLAQNLLAEIDPGIPALQERGSGLPIDLVLSALTLLTLAWAVWALRRSRRWGERHRARRWSVPLLLLPQLAAVALVLSIPRLQLAATQRTAGWRLLFTVEPVAVTLLACLGVGSLLVLGARSWATLRPSPVPPVSAEEPA